MSSKSKACCRKAALRGVGSALADLSCFARWARHEASGKYSIESCSMKIEVRCRECGSFFVKYAYDGSVRCGACRKASGRLSAMRKNENEGARNGE